ncbi:MAG: EAL domain-containing protein [Clostridium sp.]
MRKITAAIFSLLLSLIFCLTLFAAPQNTSPEPMPTSQVPNRVVRVGYFDYDGFTMTNQDGDLTGYACEYLDEIAFYTGWTYEYVPGTLKECTERLISGEIDMAGGFQYTEERGQLYHYTDYEIGTEYAMLLVKKNNDTVQYDDYNDFEGLRVGLVHGTYQSYLMEQYAANHDFSYEEHWYDSGDERNLALERDEVDAILTGSMQRNSDLKVVAKFSPTPFYFITGKKDVAFSNELNSAIEKVQTSDINFNLKLYNKYYGESLTKQVALTEEEEAYITDHPVLRVACNRDWNPIIYYDEEAAACEGICPGILRLLSERSRMELEFIPTDTEEEAAQKVQNGEADLLCAFPSSYDKEGLKYGIVLTKPYYQVPVTLAALRGTSLSEIHTVAVPGNLNSLLWHVRKLYPDLEIVTTADVDSGILFTKVGKTDAVFENAYILDQHSQEHQMMDAESILSTKTFLPMSIGMRTDADPALRTLLNRLISQLSETDVNEIVVKNTIRGSNVHPWELIRRFIFPGIAAIFLLILVLSLRSQQKIQQYAFVDPLTGYDNKTRFMISAGKLLNDKNMPGYAVACLDIDKFKMINNMHGFDVGNRILKEMSEIFRRQLGNNELFCRESDDRFALLLHLQSEEELKLRLLEIIQKISDLPQILGDNFQYTISCGVYVLEKTDKDIYSAVEWANLTRKSAKEHRQNWIAWYDKSMRKKVLEEQNIENRMEAALEHKEYQVYYQPKIYLNSGELAGAEALVRWKTEDGTMLYPDQFIPVFESNGFILKLDIYVFEQVCIQLREWIDRGLDPYPISVNLSRVHLNEPDFFLKYVVLLKKYRIPPELIEMELTESIIFENMQQMGAVLDDFKAAGIKVSIDDFGSGYSSLTLLKELSFDYLKMDKEFLNTASVTERGKKVIYSTKYLADELDMILLAEGVETLEQVEFLRSIGCELAQGYYFSKPLPIKAFEAYAGWR